MSEHDSDRIVVELTPDEADALVDAWYGDPRAYSGDRSDFTQAAIMKVQKAAAALSDTPTGEANE